jgi:hypothetical protein
MSAELVRVMIDDKNVYVAKGMGRVENSTPPPFG